MNVGHAPANGIPDQVRSQRALISALPADTKWAISVECLSRKGESHRGVLSHDGALLRFESWDGSVMFEAPLDKGHVKHKLGNRVKVNAEGRRWILREPQDLRLVMAGSPTLPRRVAAPGARFLGLFESITR
ncbi:MAG: hypothetical protein R2706_06485 [Acidimicrobiales bacterium]